MEQKRAFKGIWIPAYVWNHPDLNPQDVHIWGEIDSFTHSNGSCFASNDWLSKKFNCSSRTIQRSLVRLKNAGLIKIEIRIKEITKQTERNIRSVDFIPEGRQNCHPPMTHVSPPHDTDVIHNNTQSNNTQNNIKLHSPSFSGENIPGDSDSQIPSLPAVKTEPPRVPVQPHEKYKITEEEYKKLQDYFGGFCQELDSIAKVKYKKDFAIMVKIYRSINKDMKILRAIYTYFRLYRNHDDPYVLVIRSLAALADKFDRLLPEANRKTFDRIKETGSLILGINDERKVFAFYPYEKMSSRDRQRFDNLREQGYMEIPILKSCISVDLEDAGYSGNNWNSLRPAL